MGERLIPKEAVELLKIHKVVLCRLVKKAEFLQLKLVNN